MKKIIRFFWSTKLGVLRIYRDSNETTVLFNVKYAIFRRRFGIKSYQFFYKVFSVSRRNKPEYQTMTMAEIASIIQEKLANEH